MSTQRLCLFVLFALAWVACGEKKSPPPAPEKPAASVAPQRFKLDTSSRAGAAMPPENRSEKNTKVASPPKIRPQNQIPTKPPGSPAYITRTTAVMHQEPSETALKVSRKFNVSETVYILETKMTDAAGKSYDVPQYKIQCSDGTKGWIISRFVGLPF
jgi:hypothetical protein